MLRYFVLIILLSSFWSDKKRGKNFIPPGTVRVNDSLFVDIHEVSLRSWAEYRAVLKKEKGANSPEYLQSAIDTSVWLWGGMNSNEPYSSQHRNLNFYKDYPVVGISYEQALSYCKWRSDRVLWFLQIGKKKIPAKLEYRLPTEAEWQSIAGSASEVYRHKNSVEVKKYTKDKKVYLINYGANSFISDTLKRQGYTESIGRYKKNTYGCFDFIGNVSEIVAEKGISKGGGWMHSLEESRPEKKIRYSAPQAWLGFRCVCILK